ncbi:LLM class flavin-dependent oxidoreductase [Streptacidiphilus jiangxiensis]|uniref:Flavin-dependent oxidoreductase, luciferase family (Includes alkanesulfonate monooxygenase SsuD and methylene tetrahydromethanopterin reductase) n=1 Tax=Streptacidiphilus jiangxiensis TaxID=235985 RepID=A0A1H7W441_STRJI|nr:LLM class flavin-dependent oxidoreductase [Streptacidiphilus jiangxiensis]SEM16251.1 Flavin-dependent oxidoreductase, luciferase family (includes alkanesulfonate monooxygenase SsuD and methylene tetrahydromethanopterin reductase) [Streptacidiphilus jiangxiensis]
MTDLRIGVMYDRSWDPAGLPAFAREVEALGVDDLWVVEDLGWNGGISAAAVALGATQRLRVGLGIAPAPLRSPALLAMEIATLARVFPGRLVAGVGHGVREWMQQVGVAPRSPLALLEETLTAVRGLLRGEKVTVEGRELSISGVELVHPPEPDAVPSVIAGVVSPKSLVLAGRAAEGTLVAEGHGPGDLRAARAAAEHGGGGADHTLTVFTFLGVGKAAGPALREAVAGHAQWLGRDAADTFAAGGTPKDAAAAVHALGAAGAQTVVLRACGPEPLAQLRAVLEAL